MLNGHLSDEQLQELALNSAPGNEAKHIESCAACKAKLENYRLLMNVISKQPAPAFNFDLAAAVFAQLEPSSTKGLWWMLIVTVAGILTAAGIYFGEYMPVIYQGIKSIGTYLIIISLVVLAIMLAIDQYKTYQKKMKLLDMQ